MFIHEVLFSLPPRSGFVQQVAPVDAKTYAPFCAFASLIIAQKASPVMAQLSKALNINSKMLKFTDINLNP